MNKILDNGVTTKGSTSVDSDLIDHHIRETAFHDQWAKSEALEKIEVDASCEGITALENQFILKKMGDLQGLHLLEVGCGFGEASVYFARRGAHVTATDLSPGMVDFAIRLATSRGTVIQGKASGGENLPFEANSFDVVYTANTIHHAANREQFISEIFRVLRPGGRFFACDPLAYNPLIMVYRKLASEVRSLDEAPLGLKEISAIKAFFPDLQFRTFWILGLTLFLKYYFLDRKNPNQHRYWKLICLEKSKDLWWWKPLAWVDNILGQLPGIQLLAWNVVVWGTKPKK